MTTRKFLQSFLLIVAMFFLHTSAIWAASDADDENIYVWQNGRAIYVNQVDEVDQVAYENNKTVVTLYDADTNVLFTAEVAAIDSITFTYNTPTADLLDVVFHTDGTAEDVSPMHNTVSATISDLLTVYYNNTYMRNVAKFDNEWAGTPSAFYSVNYANNNEFMDALSDGHTLEAVFMANYSGTIANSEVKFFSSHQSGGTGLMVCKKTNGKDGGNDITFLPNVSTSGSSTWRWATSGVTPVSGTYYHVVGVWNKDEGKAYVYLNGELMNVVDAPGNLVFPSNVAKWFAIGGDPSSSSNKAEMGWNGDVVIARIYDDPLNARQVKLLWNEIEKLQANAVIMVTDVSFLSGVPIKEGNKYAINGQGFAEGDIITLTSISDSSIVYSLESEKNGEKGVFITIPTGFASDKYSITLVRNPYMQELGITKLEVVDEMPKGAEVIAHRGYWTDTAQNSRESLQRAEDLGVYGSETDVWLTTDGHLFVNHDSSFNGVTIKNATSEQCKNLILSNGETMPEITDFLEMIKTSDSPTKLIIEIKDHSSTSLNQAAASATVQAVKDYGVENKVEYISFSSAACEQIISEDPNAKVAYLNGDLTPEVLAQRGYTGLDYDIGVIRNHTDWVSDAHDRGLTVNVWTVSTTSAIIEMTELGADYITTDTPVDALDIKGHYDNY